MGRMKQKRRRREAEGRKTGQIQEEERVIQRLKDSEVAFVGYIHIYICIHTYTVSVDYAHWHGHITG